MSSDSATPGHNGQISLPEYVLSTLNAEVARLLSQMGDMPEWAHELIARATRLSDQGADKLAAPLFAAAALALDLVGTCPATDLINSLMLLANSYVRIGQVPHALRVYDHLLHHYSDALRVPSTLLVLMRHNYAFALNAMGRTTEALALYRSNYSLAHDVGILRSDLGTRICNNYALALRDSGCVALALRLLEVNLATRRELLSHKDPVLHASEVALGNTYAQAGRRDEARRQLRNAAKFARMTFGWQHECTLGAYNVLAYRLLDEGRYPRSITLFGIVRRRYRAWLGTGNEVAISAGLGLCEALRRQRRYEEAIALNESVLREIDENATLTFQWVCQNNIGVCLLEVGRCSEAINMLNRCIEVTRQGSGVQSRQYAHSLANGARACRMIDDLVRAEAMSSLAHATMQTLRLQADTPVDRATWGHRMGMQEVAFLLAAVRARLGMPTAHIVSALEDGTSRSLHELLMHRSIDQRAAASDLVQRGVWSSAHYEKYMLDQDRLAELNVLERSAVERGISSHAQDRQVVSHEQALVSERLYRAEKDVLPTASPKSLAEIARQIRPGEVLLIYGWCELGVTLVLIPCGVEGEARSVWVSRANRGEVETPFGACMREKEMIAAVGGAVEKVRRGLLESCRTEDVQPSVQHAVRFLLPPEALVMLSKARRAVVVSSGPLQEVPLDLLAELAGVEELRGKPIVTAPSGSIFAMLRERGVQDGPFWPGIVGDPDFGAFGGEGGAEADRGRSGGGGGDRGGGLDESNPPASRRPLTELDLLVRDGEGTLERLPRARTEAEQIAKYFGKARQVQVRPLVDADATVPRVREESSGKRVLHLAAHAVLGSMKDPMASAVVLAQEHGEDGTVRPGLLRLDMLLTHWGDRLKGCDLVVLSCCQTGRGVKLGDSTMALPIGFFHAGCKCVIASAWKVHDLATCLLMMRFYQNLLGVHEDHVGRPETRVRDVFGKRYAPGQAMPVTHALQEAKEWLKALSYDELADFQEAHPAPEVEPKVHPQQATDQPSPANKNGLKTAEQEFMEAAKRNKKEPPFKHPRFWAAWIIVGDPG